MAFTLDNSSSLSRVRVLIFDIDSTDYEFEDASIEDILDMASDDELTAAAHLCRSLAAKYAAEAQIIGLGKEDIFLDKTRKSRYYLQMAAQYDSQAGGNVTEFIDTFNISQDGMGNDGSEYIGDPI